MIYLDSCALVKLILTEEHSASLTAHVTSSPAILLSSELARVEVGRALIRHGKQEAMRQKAASLLDKIAQLPLACAIRTAAELPDTHLRSLDALHLATAQALGGALSQFITYDKRLAKAALDAGLPVVTPGEDV